MLINFISVLMFIIYSVLILYYRKGWLNIPVYIPLNSTQLKTFVTVIIPARNEEKDIGNCLNSILKQSYHQHLFEIIVVDDFSTDKTAEIVRSFTHKNISLLSLKDYPENSVIYSYKKKAIEIAISKSKGELIVTTDADCHASAEWLITIVSFYEKYQPAFIAAPVLYSLSADTKENISMKFLKIFQSLDFMTLQGITGAALDKKFHFMCNGANLAYVKKIFYEVDGFKGIDNIASGDDMLLMHKIVNKYPDKIMFLKSSEAIITTKPLNTISGFFNQRIRWASKSDKYSDNKILLILIIVYLFNLWISFTGILAFSSLKNLYWFSGLLVAKIIIELLFLYPVAKFFKEQKILWWFPIAQPFHIIYTIIAGWLGKYGTYEWKGRRIK